METVRFFDWVVESPDPLPDLGGDLAWGSPDVRLEFGGRGEPPAGAAWATTTLREDGTTFMETLREGAVLWIRFPGLALFSAGPGQEALRAHPLPGVPAETVRCLAVDAVLPGLRSARGKVVLRAAAVLAPEGALVFAGPEGSGKSTLAGALARRGLPLVGDDMISLDPAGEGCRASGVLTGLRLWPHCPVLEGIEPGAVAPAAPHTRKVRVDPAGAGMTRTGDPVPVRRLYLLPRRGGAGTPDLAVEEIPSREAAAALVEASFLLEPGGAGDLRERILRPPVGGLLPLARRLSVPFVAARLPAILDALLEEAAR